MDKVISSNVQLASLRTPNGLGADATRDISAALTGVLADMFALYLKTKKLPLAHVRSELSRLSPHGTMIRATRSLPPPMSWLNAPASSVEPPCARSDTSHASASRRQRCRLRHPQEQAGRARRGQCAHDRLPACRTCSLRGVWRRRIDQPDRDLIDEAERRAWFPFEATRRGV